MAATNTNGFIVNIVDLQNIALSITGKPSGSAAISQLQSDVGNLQEMVNYDTKTVYADTLSEFTAGHGISILSPVSQELTTTATTTVEAQAQAQGSMAFVYNTTAPVGLTGANSGSLPISFVSNVTVLATQLQLTLQPTYSATYFPNYIGTILWHTTAGYKSFTIPNTNVLLSGSQLTISDLTTVTLAGITPDSTGYSLWVTITVFN